MGLAASLAGVLGRLCPGQGTRLDLGVEDQLERLGVLGPQGLVVLDVDLGEQRLVAQPPGEIVAAGVETGEVIEQVETAGQDGLGVGVVRLHQLELLGFQLVALLGERVRLVSLARQEPVELVAEHPGQRLALGWSDSDATVVVLDSPFDVLDEHSPASAVRSLGVPSRADEVGVDAAVPVLGVGDHLSGAALAAVDGALEVVVVDAVRVGGRRADDIPMETIEQVARRVVAIVGEKRSTWRRANLYAEASRQTLGWRFATTRDREAITGTVVDAAEGASLRLTPPDFATTPAVFTREDGSSRFRPKHSVVFSSEQILAAENRLLKRAENRNAPTVDVELIDRHSARLSPQQSQALAMIAGSARQVDLLVGPAGAGKTTALRAVHRAWTHAHGQGSVVGLAPSAAAAAVLAEDLAVVCENTAKWLYDHQQGRARFHRGQLVIIDEATLAGTLTLDRITAHAAEAGAKVLLVGDWAQLQAVEAGGAFGLLASARDDVPELVDSHRFVNEWEKAASLELRHGRPEAVDAYLAHDRVQSSDGEDITEAANQAWRIDTDNGRATVLIADNNAAVRDLNERARAELLLTGVTMTGREAHLVDGTRASAGDLVITRRNDRRLRTWRHGWVRNGDRWQVSDVRDDGALVVRRLGTRRGGAVVLPAAYVAEHVDLGYAVTAHRAQGITVDTAHVLVTDSTTRENLYVSMTRGRESNIAYVALAATDNNHGVAHDGDEPTAKTVLLAVLANSGAEVSAHQTIKTEQETWGSLAQLIAEYETIATAAQHDRWASLLRASGLTPEQLDELLDSDTFGPLAAELRRAEASGLDVERILPVAVGRRDFDDVDDIAAVLRHRVQLATSRVPGSRTRRTRLIVGLIPEALGPMAPDMRQALDERRDLIEQRARTLAEETVRTQAPWTKALGPMPTNRSDRARWAQAAVTVAAYRDRCGITGPKPLGNATTDTQRLDRARAEAALRRGQEVPMATSQPSARAGREGLGLG
ncbi:MAG: AAA family ATPase [Nocardioidaceae bacterium]